MHVAMSEKTIIRNPKKDKDSIRVLRKVNLVKLANTLGKITAIVIKESHLVIDIDGVNLGDAIVTASHPVVIGDRLVLMDPEFGDSSKGRRRTLGRTCSRRQSRLPSRTHALRKSNMFVDWSSAAEEMSASRSLSIITFADEADILRKGVRVAIQHNPSSSGSDIRDGMRFGELQGRLVPETGSWCGTH